MLHFQFQVVFVVLFCSVLLVEIRGAPHSDMLTERLKEDLAYNKDLSPWLLLKFMSELTAARGDELLPELEEVLGVREEVMRRQLPLSHRERKAGCRNFFWKTFTSC